MPLPVGQVAGGAPVDSGEHCFHSSLESAAGTTSFDVLWPRGSSVTLARWMSIPGAAQDHTGARKSRKHTILDQHRLTSIRA
jgi:hypothetical protein